MRGRTTTPHHRRLQYSILQTTVAVIRHRNQSLILVEADHLAAAVLQAVTIPAHRQATRADQALAATNSQLTGKDARVSYDQRCHDLALAFLRDCDIDEPDKSRIAEEMAQSIQDAVELHIEFRKLRVTGKEGGR